MASSTQFESDVSRRSGLARATIALNPRAQQQQQLAEQPSDEYLDAVEAEWNKRLDGEVETLVEGMAELVEIAKLEDKDKFQIAHEAFQAQYRAEAMVKAANSLFAMTHALKLMLLIGDESQLVRQRNEELAQVRAEIATHKARAADLADDLLYDEVVQGPQDAEQQLTQTQTQTQMETQTTLVGSGSGETAMHT